MRAAMMRTLQVIAGALVIGACALGLAAMWAIGQLPH
ncbi:hypothetical protein C8E08_4999 [Paracidovorax citrulli]|nr:hypothetical protein C8E08_4999 [Paracidovorax citrulli]REG68290.1 hypothetical protein C8E07_1392 [Paracidovorax citrulli]RLJ92848.1 hypothetical protein C8E06_1393 [Paracidovorax citrulli]